MPYPDQEQAESSLRRGAGLPVCNISWGVAALTVVHILTVSLLPHSGESSTATLFRALLSCLILPVPGLVPALLVLSSGKRAQVGAFTLTALSFGFGLLVHYIMVVILRELVGPVSAFQLSLLSLIWAGGAVLLGLRLRGIRVKAEAGLDSAGLLVGLLVLVVLGIGGRHRLFHGAEQQVPVEPKDMLELTTETHRLAPGRGRLVWHEGVKKLDDGSYRRGATAPVLVLNLHLDSAPSEPWTPRIALVITAPVGGGAELWQVPNTRCGAVEKRSRPERRWATTEVLAGQNIGLVGGAIPLHNAMLFGLPAAYGGDNCFEVRLTGVVRHQPWLLSVTDLSHVPLDPEGNEGSDGGSIKPFHFMFPNTVECHLVDASYRRLMYSEPTIWPALLLWGYFTQFVVEALAGGSYPAVGVLFLFLALLNLAAAQVLVGQAMGAGLTPGRRRLAGVLLVGPMASHVISLTFNWLQSFAFPDGPYSFLLLGALTLLVLRQRTGFIVLGCLAAYARYPGAWALALALMAWLVLYKEGRAWTARTLLWSLGAGLLFIALLLAFFHLHRDIPGMLEAVYFEIFPEHFDIHGAQEGGPTAATRALHFWLKLMAISCLTPLLWPRSTSRVARMLMVVTVGYALPLMTVSVANSHYYQMMLYASAAAGLGALGRIKGRGLWMAAGVVLAGSLASQWLIHLLFQLIIAGNLDVIF